MLAIHDHYIGGRWVSGTNAADNINPSDTREIVGRYALGDAGHVEQAVQAARAALPQWSRSSPQERHDVLRRIGDELLARKDELGLLLAREEGKTLTEATGEAARAGQTFLFYAGEALRLAGEKHASLRAGIEIDITREPVGIVALVTPWNFPLAVPAWKIAPALACGNCVILKPAELVPASAWALAEIISRAGLPDGAFNLVMGEGAAVGQALVDHPGVNAVSFTGSVATGQRVALACAGRFAKFQLEMGGKNPLIVLDDADLDVAVAAALNGSFFSTGQRCTASSRLIVTQGIHDAFVARLSQRLGELRIDHACQPGTDIGPVVDARQMEQNLRYVTLGLEEGAVLLRGGQALKRDCPGFYFEPALFTHCDNAMRLCREEIFGPVASVIRVRGYEEALAAANDTGFGLSAGLCTTSLKHANHFKRNVEAGMVTVNLPTAGADFHVPFGGRKGSSFGSREQGRHAVEFYTTIKTAYIG